jgi:hypothetical protein
MVIPPAARRAGGMENTVAARAAAAVLGGAIALGAAALGLATAGVAPVAPSAAVAQDATRALKADIEIHANREAKASRLALIEPVVPGIRFIDRPATWRDLLHESFTLFDLPRTPLEQFAALPPVLPDGGGLPALRSPLDDIRNPLINDAQIESIRKRLKLTAAQDKLWPAVRDALHDLVIAHAARQKKARRGETVALDPNSPEIGRLKAAALPLFAQLRADQRRELNMLAHIIGLQSALARI